MNASHLIIFHIFFLTIQVKNKPLFHRISSPHSLIKYYVVVIESGYGTSIAASRCARAGQSECILERGKEWLSGDFPETFRKAPEHAQVNFGGKGRKLGMAHNQLGEKISVF